MRAPVDRRIFEVLGDFHRAHPAVEIVVSEQHNEELFAAVAVGEVDAAIVGLTGEPLPPGVAARVIGAEPLVLATPPGHELARGKSVVFGRLRSYPLVTLTHGSGLRVLLERACRQAGFTPHIAAATSELSSLVQLAAEGLGVALLPRSAVAGVNASRVAVVGVISPRLERRTGIAWHEGPISPAGRALLKLANRALPTSGLAKASLVG